MSHGDNVEIQPAGSFTQLGSLCFFLFYALYLSAAERHGEQEDRDLLNGDQEDCGQRGEEADKEVSRLHKKRRLFFVLSKQIILSCLV